MHIALAHPDGVEYVHWRYYQGRVISKRRGQQQALSLLRRYLLGLDTNTLLITRGEHSS